MALARKYGRNPYRWADVSEFVLKLRFPAYYNDPVVKYGYMRGDETVDYVQRIRARWAQYRGFASSGSSSVMGGIGAMPHKAKHRNRYAI
jgi:membrane-bound lytic murein transglycosylase F